MKSLVPLATLALLLPSMASAQLAIVRTDWSWDVAVEANTDSDSDDNFGFALGSLPTPDSGSVTVQNLSDPACGVSGNCTTSTASAGTQSFFSAADTVEIGGFTNASVEESTESGSAVANVQVTVTVSFATDVDYTLTGNQTSGGVRFFQGATDVYVKDFDGPFSDSGTITAGTYKLESQSTVEFEFEGSGAGVQFASLSVTPVAAPVPALGPVGLGGLSALLVAAAALALVRPFA